ncbi:zinc/manganese transport system substrate-binding protein [Bifidobacterium bohemicum]|uniref:ABC transporter substrate-binding protein n=1 Tax=Bifidobacterium bohemicum DSM 22767 TaxID=1437606 RepID=A0A086ZK32_9BIFI|nr:zinc ABC transporter substrate-binding protein [Bifidobacterium bohemicum]KFI46882.1 ABC transporter substrate-binding protein [Bifidobacterium bohemicum DSM 22767]SCB83882.1 zinc/manganese transport system substrate-binding protein [Bifidobacterium bohemicum]
MIRMNRMVIRVLATVAAVSLFLGLAACGTTNEASRHDGPITVVASVNQWGTLARQVGGPDVHVTSIVDSIAVDAHDFEPKTSDVARLEKADVTLTNGIGYDAWATKNLEHSSSDAIDISAAEAAGAKEGDNPHLWFSSNARKKVARELESAFVKQRPDKAKTFSARLEAWMETERSLEQRFRQISSEHGGVSYAATEAVVYYLLKDMGLTDGTPVGFARAVASDGEPAPADLKAFRNVLAEGKVAMLVNNEQEADATTKALVKLAGQSGVPVVNVTEQIPPDRRTLNDWIGMLADHVERAMATGAGKESKAHNT